jgi:hypothetical protein
MCPRKVNQEGPPESCPRPVVTGENPANYVFVDLDVVRQGERDEIHPLKNEPIQPL